MYMEECHFDSDSLLLRMHKVGSYSGAVNPHIMSSASWAPNETPAQLFLERIFLAGLFVGVVAFGMSFNYHFQILILMSG